MKDHVTCPGCKIDVALPDHTLLGEIVKCLACGVETEILSLGPFIPNLERVENWGEFRHQSPVSPLPASAR
jgi:lysine biosynthesis protein LysW